MFYNFICYFWPRNFNLKSSPAFPESREKFSANGALKKVIGNDWPVKCCSFSRCCSFSSRSCNCTCIFSSRCRCLYFSARSWYTATAQREFASGKSRDLLDVQIRILFCRKHPSAHKEVAAIKSSEGFIFVSDEPPKMLYSKRRARGTLAQENPDKRHKMTQHSFIKKHQL